MRKLSFFLVLFFTISFLKAQTGTEVPLDSMLVNVDKASFSSGILYDRVYDWAGLKHFNDSVNVSHQKHFQQALFELHRASNLQKFISSQELRAQYTPDSLQNVVDVGLINATFHHLNYNLENEELGALRLENDRFEELGNGKLPFSEERVFIAAPLKLYMLGENIVYRFRPEFIFQSANGREIVGLSMNPGNGASIPVIENGIILSEEVIVNYQESGYKTITFEAAFADGSNLVTEGVIHIGIAITPPAPLIVSRVLDADIPFQGYDESSAILGRLEYRIFFGNPQGKLLKPIIIIDGFDPLDRRKIQDSDPHPGQSNEAHRSIEEMMIYYQEGNPNPIEIIPELRSMGYDVVIVNHPNYTRNGQAVNGGADYIERNALTHVKLYEELNAELVENNSSEELVIVGPSMGGQISRYALAYMEKEGIPHNTRLWVSVDSPHLGANLPVGTQTLLNLINDYSSSDEANDYVINQLGSPAAKQQLIEQHKTEYITVPPFNIQVQNSEVGQQFLNGRTISQGFNNTRGHPFFVTYYNNLFNNGLNGSQGYPENLRKIALVNGSLTNSKGYNNPFVAGGIDLSGSTTPDNYANNNNKTLKVEGYTNVLGHTATVETYFMPTASSNHKISYFMKRSGLGVEYHDRFITNNNSRGVLDNVPGGWFPVQRDLAASIVNSVPCEWFIGQICVNDWLINQLDHVASFIPTVSALGFYNPNFNWNHEMDRDLVCTGEIPFDSYFGPEKNEQHTSFTEASIAWLYQELEGNPQPPTVYVDSAVIMGPEVICSGDTVTYDFEACQSPAVDHWEVSNNLNIVVADPMSVTVEPANANSNGAAFVKAVYVNHSVTKNLWIGEPAAATGISGPLEVDTGSMVTYHGAGAQGATSFVWWLPYPFDETVDVRNPIDFNGDNWQTWPDQGYHNYHVYTGLGGHNGMVQFFGRNSCGDGGSYHIDVVHTNNGNCTTCYDPVTPYPNVADSHFNLDFSEYPEGTYYIYVYDAYFNVMYEGSSTNIEKTVATANIPDGVYFLHIHDGSEVIIKQLVVEH